jgi:hypothetical protein
LIYVRRNPALIPEKVLRVAERAQQALEEMPEEERKAFIERKAYVWRAFVRYLAKMSYGKCWYSESNDPQSFFDVDHFRPKKEALRAEEEKDDGYPWLAFSWENFRYAAQRSNRLSTDEETDEVAGKGSWFPLLDGSPKASWENRCQDQENPVLLDPTKKADVDLFDIDANGRACASMVCIGEVKQRRVHRSIELYGLNLGNLVSARKRVMREVNDHYENLIDVATADNDMPAVQRLIDQMRRATLPDSAYSRAVRAQLGRLPHGATFCAQPEDMPL